jgi:putative endonuclease
MRNFYYVYVLRSLRDKGLYIGSTRDLRTRLRLHNGGAVRSTNPRRPFELIFHEAYRSEYDAKRREIYLKSTKGRSTLKTMLQNSLRASEPAATYRTARSDAPSGAAGFDSWSTSGVPLTAGK